MTVGEPDGLGYMWLTGSFEIHQTSKFRSEVCVEILISVYPKPDFNWCKLSQLQVLLNFYDQSQKANAGLSQLVSIST